MYPANVIALGVAAFKGTETEQRIAVLLYDDNFQVISSFELNQIASLTYHEGSLTGDLDLTERIFEHLVTITSTPSDYSPLSVEKALVVTKHILIFGATKVIQPTKLMLAKRIESLQQYNTALLAQQQTGATGVWNRLKGGSVDKGGPVRELAIYISRLLDNDNALQFERNTQADPNSLVPIGDRKKVVFISDEARLRFLKKKMEHHKLMEQRSNLAKASDGFGGGYMSRDGKAVVGAAHGIDEMIRQAQRDQERFQDEQNTKYQAPPIDVEDLKQYAQEIEQQYGYSRNDNNDQQQQQQPEIDLLALDHHHDQYSSSLNVQQQNEVDLLDFGGTTSNPTTTSSNIGGSTFLSPDIFGSTSYTAPSPDIGQVANAADLLSVMSLSSTTSTTNQTITSTNFISNPPTSSIHHDPFAPPPQQQQQLLPQLIVPKQTKNPIMSSNDDRFAALDILSSGQNSLNPASTFNYSNSNNSNMSGGGMPFLGLGDTTTKSTTGLSNNNFGGNNSMMTGINNNLYGGSSMIPSASNAFAGIGMMGGAATTTSAMMMMPTMTPTADLSSIQVSQTYTPAVDDDDIASGFVMGGTTGSGLEPSGAAPAAPPPPPPPPSYW